VLDCVEAAANGSALGDPIEARSITASLCRHARSKPLMIHNIKSCLGHGEPASGTTGILKLAATLCWARGSPNAQLRVLAKHVVSALNPAVCHLPTRANDLKASGFDDQGSGGVSSFGFSGTLAHSVLGVVPSSQFGDVVLLPLISGSTHVLLRRFSWSWKVARDERVMANHQRASAMEKEITKLVQNSSAVEPALNKLIITSGSMSCAFDSITILLLQRSLLQQTNRAMEQFHVVASNLKVNHDFSLTPLAGVRIYSLLRALLNQYYLVCGGVLYDALHVPLLPDPILTYTLQAGIVAACSHVSSAESTLTLIKSLAMNLYPSYWVGFLLALPLWYPCTHHGLAARAFFAEAFVLYYHYAPFLSQGSHPLSAMVLPHNWYIASLFVFYLCLRNLLRSAPTSTQRAIVEIVAVPWLVHLLWTCRVTKCGVWLLERKWSLHSLPLFYLGIVAFKVTQLCTLSSPQKRTVGILVDIILSFILISVLLTTRTIQFVCSILIFYTQEYLCAIMILGLLVSSKAISRGIFSTTMLIAADRHGYSAYVLHVALFKWTAIVRNYEGFEYGLEGVRTGLWNHLPHKNPFETCSFGWLPSQCHFNLVYCIALACIISGASVLCTFFVHEPMQRWYNHPRRH
jgi:hypothetical protein